MLDFDLPDLFGKDRIWREKFWLPRQRIKKEDILEEKW